MHMNRRHFLLFLGTSMVATGCKSVEGGNTAALPKSVNIGSANNYAKDGVYRHYRDVGFFVIRQGGKLFALSSYCTHRKCKLSAERDSSFYCPCHGSTFDPGGHVTKGPARKDLPVYTITSDERGELIVQTQQPS
jgi:Rieske Fe-S protein